MDETEAHARRFLARFFPPPSSAGASPTGRPRVTLTFAQSLDAKIAGPGGRQVAISGRASLVMTHVLRTRHAAILVGIGTLLNDNPQLNARQLSPAPPVQDLPVPVVLDGSFRTPLGSKVLANAHAGRGKAPLLIGAGAADSDRATRLAQAGAQLAVAPSTWPAALRVLQERGLRSVMVEGGARVISTLLQAAQAGVVVDCIVITIGKTMLGSAGVGYDVPEGLWRQFEHVASEEFGDDTVVVFRPRASTAA